jgi:hypothetical protein
MLSQTGVPTSVLRETSTLVDGRRHGFPLFEVLPVGFPHMNLPANANDTELALCSQLHLAVEACVVKIHAFLQQSVRTPTPGATCPKGMPVSFARHLESASFGWHVIENDQTKPLVSH